LWRQPTGYGLPLRGRTTRRRLSGRRGLGLTRVRTRLAGGASPPRCTAKTGGRRVTSPAAGSGSRVRADHRLTTRPLPPLTSDLRNPAGHRARAYRLIPEAPLADKGLDRAGQVSQRGLGVGEVHAGLGVDVEDGHAGDRGAGPAGGGVGDVVGADDEGDVGPRELGVDLFHLLELRIG